MSSILSLFMATSCSQRQSPRAATANCLRTRKEGLCNSGKIADSNGKTLATSMFTRSFASFEAHTAVVTVGNGALHTTLLTKAALPWKLHADANADLPVT